MPRSDDNLLFLEEGERAAFWEAIETSMPGLPGACGCYVFAIRSGGGTLPWYVGKAERQSFKSECLTRDKVRKYNSILQSGARGTPLLYLYARTSPTTQKFSRPSKSRHRDITFLEQMLIDFAVHRNPDVVNKQETVLLRTVVVPGLLNSPPGKLSTAAQDLKSVLGY